MSLSNYLKNNIVLWDGALGTYYQSKHPEFNGLVEKQNIINSREIIDIHKEYLEAGARILRTNTFAANPDLFTDEKERLDIVTAGFLNAKTARDEYLLQNPNEEVFILADIGTIFAQGEKSIDVQRDYCNIIDSFLESGAKDFLFETQNDFLYLSELVSYIKEKSDSEVFISFALDKTGYTKAGLRIGRVFEKLEELDIDGYGLNCGMSSSHMKKLFEEVSFYSKKPVFALPNAGYPFNIRGQIIYDDNEEYFAINTASLIEIGIDGVGGCCGTTPKHIKSLFDEISKHKKGEKKISKIKVKKSNGRTYSAFYEKLNSNELPFIVELDPPFTADASKVFEGARKLKNADVDLLTLSDSPMARTRMDACQLAVAVQKEVNIPVMPHMTCRDRNVIALRSVMLANYMNDLRHFLIITGDPVAIADRGGISQVYDYNSIRFMDVLKEMNQDEFDEDRIVYGGALNYHGVNIDAIAKRMELKMENGCEYFLTQPVYSDDDIKRLFELKQRTNAKIMAGIMPLVSYKNANFVANEMPGIYVPSKILSLYREDYSREQYEKVAIDVSVDIARKLQGVADGYYLMTPFSRVDLIIDIINQIRAL